MIALAVNYFHKNRSHHCISFDCILIDTGNGAASVARTTNLILIKG